jgi:hypothetical protein
MKFHGFGKKADPVHLGHALVRKQESDGIVAGLELAKSREGGAARVGAHNAIAVGIVAAKVSLDGSQDFGVVVDGQ